MHTEVRYRTHQRDRGVFAPLVLHGETLDGHNIKRLYHDWQVPRLIPKQGLTYWQSKTGSHG
ncbi:MAG: hypothetical protein LBR62_01840 [Puniceicoccales bacterium]|nr:hypothetical protein [Puniceicoccales bacterium]